MLKDVGSFLLPTAGGGGAVSTGGPMNLIGVSSNSKFKAEAWKFIEFISQSEWQGKFAEASFNVPGMKGAFSAEFLKANAWFGTFQEAIDVAEQIPPPGFETKFSPVRKALNNALGDIFILGKPVQERLKAAQSELEKLAIR
jgi:ABC-type glycerol-3-phosphate transport system substrate-binding protein